MNHFQSKCKQHRYVKQYRLLFVAVNGTLSVFIVGDRHHAMITLNLGDGGVPVPFQTDSESECCVLSRHIYVRVTGDRSLAKLWPVKNCHCYVQRNTRECAGSV